MVRVFVLRRLTLCSGTTLNLRFALSHWHLGKDVQNDVVKSGRERNRSTLHTQTLSPG